MKVKINPRQLFNQELDIRQYLDIGYNDEDVETIDKLYEIGEYELERIIENFLSIRLRPDRLPDLIEVDYEGNKHYTKDEIDTQHSGWQKYAEAMARVEFLEALIELNNATINKLLETNNKLLEHLTGGEEDAE